MAKPQLCALWGARSRENTIIDRVRSIPEQNRTTEKPLPSAAALQGMAGWFFSALAGPSYWHGGEQRKPPRKPLFFYNGPLVLVFGLVVGVISEAGAPSRGGLTFGRFSCLDRPPRLTPIRYDTPGRGF